MERMERMGMRGGCWRHHADGFGGAVSLLQIRRYIDIIIYCVYIIGTVGVGAFKC